MDACSLVIFGISGNLAQTKILPAIGNLGLGQVIGVSRRPVTLVEHLAGDVHEERTFVQLRARLKYPPIFYLAVSPDLYPVILTNMHDMQGRHNRQAKLVLEKPFGRDMVSALELGKLVSKYFEEEQVYRIDHYLGKQSVRALAGLKKAGIRTVQLVATETKGIEGRGVYYDAYGSLRDVGQNHILQMIKLATGTPISKIKIDMQSVRFGQYAGYRQEEGVRPKSQTETAFSFGAWVGTIRVRVIAGKKLAEDRVEMRIGYDVGEVVVHQIGSEPDAYARLMGEVVKGEHKHFVSEAEIEDQWQAIQPILDQPPKLAMYNPGAKTI